VSTKKDEGAFEKGMTRLAEIVELLEQGDLPLDRSVALYKEGLKLSDECRSVLETAKNEVQVLEKGAWKAFETADADETEEVTGDDEGHP
jgi:exodeoxyribonuclease VII small subunit